MTEVTRHFTATTFIVHEAKVLLHVHPKQHLWLPPGGHIERDELPHVAALREVEEETGFTVTLHSEEWAQNLSRVMKCGVVPQPAFILIEDINQFHQHVDFTYFAQLLELPRSGAPLNDFSWFALHDLIMENVPENVRQGADQAIRYFHQ